MPNIHGTGEDIPEIAGRVIGGTTIVLHRPEEVPPLLKFIERVAQPPDAPLASVSRALTASRTSLAEWLHHFSMTPSPSPPNEPVPLLSSSVGEEEPSMLRSDLLALEEAIRMAHDLWNSAPAQDQQEMVLLVAIAELTGGERKPLRVEGEGVTFAILRGSLIATVAKLPLAPTVFFVGLVSGGGATPSARVQGLVRRLRASAAKQTTGAALPAITERDFVPDQEKPLVVLVHGLFDTDVGLFGNLETLLREHFAVAGFPHDTLLTGVKSNGFDLAQILATLPARQGISLVCHSRGGLVARSAIQQLQKSKSKLVKACVTFGTPHAGSPIAETPGSLIAAVAMAKMALRTFSGATLLDMMSAATLIGDLPGIDDLKPPRKGKTFIEDLRKDEGTFFDEQVPFMVIGGEYPPARVSEWVTSRALGPEPNDLVVLLESSVPRMSAGTAEKTACNHYQYFQPNQAALHKKVIEFLKNTG